MPSRLFRPGEDRRRNPRFGCNGPANITCLPAHGGLLQGTIRNLSVGGCFIETGLLLPCGARTEILARVHTSSFRALGQVRAILGRAGICVEFVRLSAGGEYLLTELVKNLAKVRTAPYLIASAASRQEPPDPKDLVFSCLGNFQVGTSSEALMAVVGPDRTIIEGASEIDAVNLFA